MSRWGRVVAVWAVWPSSVEGTVGRDSRSEDRSLCIYLKGGRSCLSDGMAFQCGYVVEVVVKLGTNPRHSTGIVANNLSRRQVNSYLRLKRSDADCSLCSCSFIKFPGSIDLNFS